MAETIEKPLFRIAVVGHLDHGKSTLIGRLKRELGKSKAPAGADTPDDLAFVVDQLREEQEGGFTFDTAQVFVETTDRQLVFIDVPGHQELIRNMLTGVTQADSAILVLAADEGVQAQTQRHALLLSILGIESVAVVLNKMDLRGFDEKICTELSGAVQALFRKAGMKAPAIIPVSAKEGDNVVGRSHRMPWYSGQTLLDFILGLLQPEAVTAGARFAVQDVYRFDGSPVVAGKLLSGTLTSGDILAVCPQGDLVTVREVRRFPSDTRPATAGESVGLILAGQIPERGNVLAPALDPPTVCTRFSGRVFWLVEAPLAVGEVLTFRCATQSVPVTVDSIGRRVDSSTLDPLPDGPQLAALEVGTARFSAQSPVVLEPFPRVPALGRFILQRNGVPVGAGIILERDA